MLVLSRKVGEAVIIGGGICVTVVAIQGSQIRLGFTAPDDVPIYRQELCSPLQAVAKVWPSMPREIEHEFADPVI
jgi:carbon storage regulator